MKIEPISVKVLKGQEAETWKSLMWLGDRMKETKTPASIVDGIIRKRVTMETLEEYNGSDENEWDF